VCSLDDNNPVTLSQTEILRPSSPTTPLLQNAGAEFDLGQGPVDGKGSIMVLLRGVVAQNLGGIPTRGQRAQLPVFVAGNNGLFQGEAGLSADFREKLSLLVALTSLLRDLFSLLQAAQHLPLVHADAP
jgi:hypothetical protein